MTGTLGHLQKSLEGHYAIERELGHGGMATVYLARDLKHGRSVAIKVLSPELSVELGASRFLREIAFAARLQHPHILPLYDSGEAGTLFYYVMPFVEGESLRDRLTREPRLPLADALRIAREVAAALAFAHGHDVVHRDIKPENILISGGEAVVADFGIARAITVAGGERVTQSGITLGTPTYMSPEQAAGETRLDGRTDVYSLGCVLYEMLAGQPPFVGPTLQAVIAMRFREAAPPLRAARPDASEEVERVVAKALATDPEERFSSAFDLAAALTAAAADLARDAGRARPGQVQRSERSIAVLPFVNMSPDPENEYFSDGVTEELINALVKVQGVRVVSRTSAFAFKGKQDDVRKIGRQLNVDTVLEGSVRKAVKRIRVTAQLITVADGYHLWSDTYDRELEDVFAVQDEISRAIVGVLKVQLLGDPDAPLVKKATDDVEAYTLYLKGRYHWNRRTEADLRKGLKHFEEALARDPGYTLASIGVADSYNILGFYSWLPPKESFPRAKAAAELALERDGTLATAYCSRGYARFYHDWDWAGAEQDFLQSIALDPSYGTAPQFYGNLLAFLGRGDESIVAMKQALKIDPASPIRNAAAGWAYYQARRFGEAVAQLRATTELDPNFMIAHLWLGQAYAQTGQLDEAADEINTAIALSAHDAIALSALGSVHARAGRRDEATQIIAELDDLAGRRYVPQYNVAMIHAALGQPDLAFARLERAYQDRAHQMVFLRVDPAADPLRTDPRFAVLLKRVGL